MTAPAAPPDSARRPSFGLAFLVVAFIYLAPPLFLLTPLAMLLLFSRPRTLREWLWLAMAGGGTVYFVTIVAQADLVAKAAAAGGLMMAGAFVLTAMAWRRSSTVSRALIAAVTAVAGVAIWSRGSGLELATFDAVIGQQFEAAFKSLLAETPTDQATAIMASVPMTVRVFPAWLILQGIAGLGLAWRWYHRIAAEPLGPTPGPFREFRFNDHLIWGAIFTLGLILVPFGDPLDRIVTCALVVWIGLYGTRGAAVVATTVGAWPLPGKILLVVLSFLAFPLAIGTSVAFGVADTWLDFRNRTVPNAGGSDADGSDSP